MTYPSDLKKLAQAVTPGPWQYDHTSVYIGVTKDAAFVKACSPERILTMLAVIEAAKAARMMNTDEAIAILDAALAKLEGGEG